MKKCLALFGAVVFASIPSLSVAENVSPKKSHVKQVINKLEADFNDGILIAHKVKEFKLEPRFNLMRSEFNVAELERVKLASYNSGGDITSEGSVTCLGKNPNNLGCNNNSFVAKKPKVKVDISEKDLPFRLKCSKLNGDLLIKQNKSDKFVVKGLREDNWFNRYFKRVEIKKFHKGLDFNEALKVFQKTYKDKCGI